MNPIFRYLRALGLSGWLKVAAVGIIFAVALNTNLFDMLRRGFDIRFLWAALAVQPLILAGLTVHSVRHMILIGQPKVPLGRAFKAMALSQGLNLILPGRLSEVLKGSYLRDHAGVPMSAGMSAVVLERTVDLLIVVALGILGLSLFATGVDRGMVAGLGVMGTVILLLALRARTPMIRLARALPWPRLAGFAERAYSHFADTVRTTAFLKALLLGMLGWAISYANIFVFMTLAGSVPIGMSGALLVLVFTTLGAAVPALPGGVGTYEAAGIFALRSLGYDFHEALGLAIVLHASQLVLPFILAIVVMMTERIGLSALIADLRASAQPDLQK